MGSAAQSPAVMDGALVDGYLGGRLLPEDVRSFLTARVAQMDRKTITRLMKKHEIKRPT